MSDQTREIKQALRGMMNGPVSASMRSKGLAYRVNFGVELPRLVEYAATLPHERALAAELWQEDIRECRILAALLMPPAEFAPEVADVWVEQMRFAEEAEQCTMHLFAHTPWASGRAFRWVADERELFQLCGFLLFARLFMQGKALDARDADEYLDQTLAALRSERPAVRRAAHKALLKYMDLGEREALAGERLLRAFEQ